MLFLRRYTNQSLLVVPSRVHTADEITRITVRDISPKGDVGFGFDIADGWSISLEEKYSQRHGHDLTEERCTECGLPIGLFAGEGKELHVARNLCPVCYMALTRKEKPSTTPSAS